MGSNTSENPQKIHTMLIDQQDEYQSVQSNADLSDIDIKILVNELKESKSCQVSIKSDPKLSLFQKSIDLNVVCDLVDILKGSIDEKKQWKSKQDRIFSTIIYMLLRYYNVNYQTTSKCMDQILPNGMRYMLTLNLNLIY